MLAQFLRLIPKILLSVLETMGRVLLDGIVHKFHIPPRCQVDIPYGDACLYTWDKILPVPFLLQPASVLPGVHLIA
jgi:hypothetical protein